MTVKKPQYPGIFRADEAYSLKEFGLRAGMGNWALKEARKDGLRVVRIGHRLFVRGKDFLDFLEKQANESAESE